MPPQTLLTVVIRPDPSPDTDAGGDDRTGTVHLAVFAKFHHLDDRGTVDSLALGEFAPREIRFGDLEDVVAQVRAVLVEGRDDLRRAAARHADAEIDFDDLEHVPLEVDVDLALSRRFGEQYDVDDVRARGERGE